MARIRERKRIDAATGEAKAKAEVGGQGGRGVVQYTEE